MAHSLEFNWHSADGTVHARLGWPAHGECHIYDFATDDRRKGHGRRALAELRPRYRIIRAIDVGDETNPNRKFWIKMANEGLVDMLIDFDGGIVWPISPHSEQGT